MKGDLNMIKYYELEVTFLDEDGKVICTNIAEMKSPKTVCRFMNETVTDLTAISCNLVTVDKNGNQTRKRIFTDFYAWDWGKYAAFFLYDEEIGGAGKFGECYEN